MSAASYKPQTIPQTQSSNSSKMVGNNVKKINPNYNNIEELIDLSKPFKKIDDATSNILITNDYNPKIIFGDSKGVIHVFYYLDFSKEYEIKEFTKIIRCIIQLSSLIVAASNDGKVKVFSIQLRSYTVIKEIEDGKEIWTLCPLGKNLDFIIGNIYGDFYRCKNTGKDYEIQKRFNQCGRTLLNLLDLSDSIVMILYFRTGAYFFDFSTSERVGFISHEFFSPFKSPIPNTF